MWGRKGGNSVIMEHSDTASARRNEGGQAEPRIDFPGEARKRLADLFYTTLRKLVGRGPQEIKIQVTGCSISVFLYDFLTPLETTLLRRGRNRDLVCHVRERLLEEMFEVWSEALRREFALSLKALHGQTDVDRNVRVITLVVDRVE